VLQLCVVNTPSNHTGGEATGELVSVHLDNPSAPNPMAGISQGSGDFSEQPRGISVSGVTPKRLEHPTTPETLRTEQRPTGWYRHYSSKVTPENQGKTDVSGEMGNITRTTNPDCPDPPFRCGRAAPLEQRCSNSVAR